MGEYADDLDLQAQAAEAQSPGVLLLAACKEILAAKDYLPTHDMITALVCRDEEPWYRWNNGGPISPERLAGLLRPYGIHPAKSRDMRTRGYYRASFADAWAYVSGGPALPPHNPVNPVGDGQHPCHALAPHAANGRANS
ncbi:MAG: DUF3631 domain-containing protein [Gemmataceae bacterium]